MKSNYKIILYLLVGLFILSSCGDVTNNNEISNSIKSKESNNIINENNSSSVQKREKIKEDLIKNISKNIKKSEKIDYNTLKNNLNKCENEDNGNICKKIEIENYGKKTKDIKVCDLLENKNDISRCEQKIVGKLVSRELDKKYCYMLKEDFQKEECIMEYNMNLEMQIDNKLQLEEELEKNVFDKGLKSEIN